MIRLLDDYIFDDYLRYEAHQLVYTPDTDEPVVFGGILAASILGALLSVTDEGEARGINLDTPEGRNDFFVRYEKEVLADNGGLLSTEVQRLNEAYLEFTTDEMMLARICRNDRLFDRAIGLMMEYMHRLVREQVCDHIWELFPWKAPFAQWLWDAAQVETRRQRLLKTDWTDMVEVNALANPTDQNEPPTLIFEGEAAEDILSRYFEWFWAAYQKQAREIPGSRITDADKRYIIEQESDYGFLSDEIATFDEEAQQSWQLWMDQWTAFVNRRLKPEKPVTFWTKAVTEEQQEKLLDYLKIQERQPQRYKCLAVAVYALRQLGYVTYNLSLPRIAKWLSARLLNDYSSKTGIYQLRRAWNNLSRYNPAVQEEVERLGEYGVKGIK